MIKKIIGPSALRSSEEIEWINNDNHSEEIEWINNDNHSEEIEWINNDNHSEDSTPDQVSEHLCDRQRREQTREKFPELGQEHLSKRRP